jgi:hypothetical protein
MSSSPNLEKTPSSQLETKTFEVFGWSFTLNIKHETRAAWEQRYYDTDNNEIDTSDPKWVDNLNGAQPRVEWVETDQQKTLSYPEQVIFRDQEECAEGKPVVLLSTPDGPILGILLHADEQAYELLDPCVVQFDSKGAKLAYMPIFNVARKLRILSSGIRTQQVPAEIIIASYPGFILQNRMASYQLKANVPYAQTSELTTDADAPVTSDVT